MPQMLNTSTDIVGKDGFELQGKRIVLGVTGSISAYRAADIARDLMRHGADVHAVMTSGAQKVVHPNLLEWATGNPVVTELTGKIEHVAFTTGEARADLILIAPATANTIGKMASGIDDTPVTSYVSSAFGAGIPILVAPAMHDTMISHPLIKQNIRKLEKAGVVFISPRMEEGKAKLAYPDQIIPVVISALSKKDMKGLKVLITGGPTVEPIDLVRVLTNRSSGRMATAMAEVARNRGADVTMVYGPGAAAPPGGIRVVNIQTAEEMGKEVGRELKRKKYDLMVAAAAVSDYRPSKKVSGKIKSKPEKMSLELTRTPKIIESAKKLSPSTFLAIFKAEDSPSEANRVKATVSRMKEVGADMAIVNYVGSNDFGFGSEMNEVTVVDSEGKKTRFKKAPKARIADEILSLALQRLPSK
jgi:phosphopantothenoylcysteine decarboxylase / phosphopantothenate---cysteine ligase